jgi:hypothetical protein
MNKEQFGTALVSAVLSSFEYAYTRHARGESLESILIDHDIVSAGSNIKEPVVKLHRKAIRSACEAVDAGVPLNEAGAFLYKQMRDRIDQFVKEHGHESHFNS